jgi:thiamine biosynthesis protein ThiI
MKEVLLCKYGELALKGLNRGYFEKLLKRELEMRLKLAGNFKVALAQSTIYVEPTDDDCDIDEALRLCRKVFGITTVARAAVAEKNIDDIKRVAKEYLPAYLRCHASFKADARRSDKKFPLTSPEISRQVGGAVLEAMPHIKVNLQNPSVVVMTEIREENAYIHAGSFQGAGGMPNGSNGKGLLLLSGGIDSPVAGFMMAKRGVTLEAVHFESYPYTSEQARDKVIKLAEIVSEYCGKIKVHVISLTHLQEVLRDTVDEEYFTLLLRRSMMRLAERVAERNYCQALITGEAVGQVASQTMQALTVTDAVVNRPVFRPCIGMDKEEIIAISRRIETFETSILPFEDCCTVFTPKHPKTRPDIEKVILQEQKYDHEVLENEAFDSLYTVEADAYADI